MGGGTWAYMAPERLGRSAVTPASDFFSLGVMLYQALTGRPPFGVKDVEMSFTSQRLPVVAPRELVPGVPEWLSDLCTSMLAFDPRRPPVGRGDPRAPRGAARGEGPADAVGRGGDRGLRGSRGRLPRAGRRIRRGVGRPARERPAVGRLGHGQVDADSPLPPRAAPPPGGHRPRRALLRSRVGAVQGARHDRRSPRRSPRRARDRDRGVVHPTRLAVPHRAVPRPAADQGVRGHPRRREPRRARAPPARLSRAQGPAPASGGGQPDRDADRRLSVGRRRQRRHAGRDPHEPGSASRPAADVRSRRGVCRRLSTT